MAFLLILVNFAKIFKLIVAFHGFNLVQNVLKHCVGRQIVEFSQSGVDTFGIVKSDSSRPICFIDALWLPKENNFIELGRVNTNMVCSVMIELIEDIVVEETLLPVDLAALVSGLSELVDQPL